ncbi:MAG: hypothetical protein ACFFDU_01890 [Candidatus Thorarchaeota archaeon]
MSKVSKKREPFKLQIMDLLLQLPVPAGIADEVAGEVMKHSTRDTPPETIRSMIIDSLRKHDAMAAEKLAIRFEYVERSLENIQRDTIGPAGEIYDEQALDELLEDDEITAAELYFMEGREGHVWQRKKEHVDTVSTELAEEDRYDD